MSSRNPYIPSSGEEPDWQHHTLQGMNAWFMTQKPNVSGLRDRIGQPHTQTVTGIQATYQTMGPLGRAYALPGSSQNHWLFPASLWRYNLGGLNLTITMMAKIPAASGSSVFLDKPFNSHNPPYYQYMIQMNSSGIVTWRLAIAGQHRPLDSDTRTDLVDKWVRWFFIFRRGGSQEIWADYERIGLSTQWGGAVSQYTVKGLRIGDYGNLPGSGPSKIHWQDLRLYRRALTRENMDSIVNNAWKPFEKPSVIGTGFDVAAPPGTDVPVTVENVSSSVQGLPVQVNRTLSAA